MKKKFSMPTAYTILVLIIVAMAGLTWILPGGQYDYVDPDASKLEPIPGTYHAVAASPQGFGAVAQAPVEGFKDAVDVALFVIVIGGFLGVVMYTGAIDAGIGRVVEKLKGREKWMIPVLMTVFALGGATFGMDEETLAFFALLIPIFLAAGYDTLTTFSVIKLGAGIGCLTSIVNPFAVGIASNFAGISIGEGMGLRVALLVILLLVAIFYTMRYAENVRKDPKKSLVYAYMAEHREHFMGKREGAEMPELTGKRKVILGLFALTFLIMVMGVVPFSDLGITAIPTLSWWFGELTALFLVSAILIAFVAGVKEEATIDAFIAGAKDLLGVALIIGLARGITVVMNAGHISDTVLHLGETTIAGQGSTAFIVLTYLFYIPMSFIIPSTSGLATLSMPIMAPMGDFANVGRDLVITAYVTANGLVNLFCPTSAVVMGGLAISKIPYEKWLKYVWKLLVIVFVISLAGLIVGVL